MAFAGILSTEWCDSQIQRMCDYYVPPVESIPSNIPQGLFVRISGIHYTGERLFAPSLHGETIETVNAYFPNAVDRTANMIALVTKSSSLSSGITLSIKKEYTTVLNTGVQPLLPHDTFIVELPDKTAMDAQRRYVTSRNALSSCGGAEYHDSLKLLAGGLLATNKVDPQVVDSITHKAIRDLNYLESTKAGSVLPEAVLKFALHSLSAAKHVMTELGNDSATMKVVDDFTKYMNENTNDLPDYNAMVRLACLPALKTFMCDGLEAFINYYKVVGGARTCGYVRSSVFINPTPINGTSVVYNAQTGQNMTMSAMKVDMLNYNGH
uniref:Uncharacterized protein n=1 Tax=Ranid herpesvirus 4 TaxID=2849006 RepID=A0A8F3HSX4_9VIRU|nr:MAG: hypothetical protein [Ranid herpesvirus 4]